MFMLAHGPTILDATSCNLGLACSPLTLASLQMRTSVIALQEVWGAAFRDWGLLRPHESVTMNVPTCREHVCKPGPVSFKSLDNLGAPHPKP
jgi:hypothetical protein